jgi:hypothetical protein
VGRILAHVDAAFPLALERVDDVERHRGNARDLDPDVLAVLQGTEPCVVGAAGDHIVGVAAAGLVLDELHQRLPRT